MTWSVVVWFAIGWVAGFSLVLGLCAWLWNRS